MTNDEIAALARELVGRHDFLASRRIPFLIVIVPEKYSVYPEFLPQWAVPVTTPSPLDRVLAELARYPRLNVVDLREPLRAAKARERVYYRTDSHWNYVGAMIGYAEMMREAMRLVPGLGMTSAPRPVYVAGVDYYSDDLAQMLGLSHALREDDIAPLGKILAAADKRCAQRERATDATVDSAAIEVYVYRCANAPSFTALVYRDSNAIPLIPMLAENFARSTFVSSARLEAALVERLKPESSSRRWSSARLPPRSRCR